MENLPVELIQRICDHLCLHCQLPSSFAHADTWQVRESKDALANLSAASSWLRAIAQPVLFHYFATGKLILTHRQNNLPQPDSPLSLFIRSAIRRPDLAARVKALQLVQSSQFASDLDAVADCVGPIFDKVRHGSCSDRRAESYFKYSINAWLDGTRRPGTLGHHWLIQVALLLVPNLQTLSVARDNNAGYHIFELGNVTLPSLKTIALQPGQKSFHVYEGKALFAAAPNLEVLYAVGCDRKDRDNNPNEDEPFDLILGNLRKLVISDLELYDLERLLPACPRLEELQYIRAKTEVVDRHTIPLKALASVQGTLQTLKIKFTEFSVRAEPARSHPRVLTTIESFRGFVALRELVIEYAAVNLPVLPVSNSPTLVDWLPPSVERVHFWDVFQAGPFLDHLSIIASEASARLPKLRFVCITPGYHAYANWLQDRNWRSLLDKVTAEFDRAGITFTPAAPVKGEREPWLDSIYPDLTERARQFGYESF